MLQDLAQIFQNKEPGHPAPPEQSGQRGPLLSKEEIDGILEEAWENSIVDPGTRQRTEKALIAARTLRYARGIATALRNKAYTAMLDSDYKNSIENAQQSLSLIDEQEALLAGTAWDIISLCYNALGSYKTAVEAVYKSRALFENCDYTRGIAWSHHNLGLIFTNIGDLNRAMVEYQTALSRFEEIAHPYGITRLCDLLSQICRKQGDYDTAMTYLKRVKQALPEEEQSVQTFSLYASWGITRRLMGDYEDAEKAFDLCGPILKVLNNPELEAHLEFERSLLLRDQDRLKEAMILLESSVNKSRENGLKPQLKDIERARSELFELMGKPAEALRCYKSYDALSRELLNSETLQNIRNLETQKEIELAEKQKDYHRRLQQETEKILSNVLPGPIVKELKTSGRVVPKSIPSATVLFTDFVGFTAISARTSAEGLVTELDYCFTGFDAIMEELGIEKLKTIGDGYMAVAGALQDEEDHAERCVKAGLKIREFMREYGEKCRKERRDYWNVRIGIHTGPIIGGVIGHNKFAYDVWGDTVNTASRMESSGHVGEVNISCEVYNRIKDRFACLSIGEVRAKGKGMLEAYTVQGIL